MTTAVNDTIIRKDNIDIKTIAGLKDNKKVEKKNHKGSQQKEALSTPFSYFSSFIINLVLYICISDTWNVTSIPYKDFCQLSINTSQNLKKDELTFIDTHHIYSFIYTNHVLKDTPHAEVKTSFRSLLIKLRKYIETHGSYRRI